MPASGEVPERSIGAVSKTVVPFTGYRGFESLPLRQTTRKTLNRQKPPSNQGFPEPTGSTLGSTEGSEVTHLKRKGGRYYWRRRVPLDLKERIGKAELVRSLGTSDPREARELARLAGVEADAMFANLRAERDLPPPDVDEAVEGFCLLSFALSRAEWSAATIMPPPSLTASTRRRTSGARRWPGMSGRLTRW